MPIPDRLPPDGRSSAVDGIVFVVDDEEPMRNALRRLLSSAKLSVQTLSSAAEFLEKYERRGPGCVVLDLNMPGMSGLELQKELQSRDTTLPIIFLTGAGSVPQAVSAMRAGAANSLKSRSATKSSWNTSENRWSWTVERSSTMRAGHSPGKDCRLSLPEKKRS